MDSSDIESIVRSVGVICDIDLESNPTTKRVVVATIAITLMRMFSPRMQREDESEK